jgi:hypothetical protein
MVAAALVAQQALVAALVAAALVAASVAAALVAAAGCSRIQADTTYHLRRATIRHLWIHRSSGPP